MANGRSWTPEEIAKLRELAGKRTSREIANEIGRTAAAVNMEASKRKISLNTGHRMGWRRTPGGSDADRASLSLLFSALGYRRPN